MGDNGSIYSKKVTISVDIEGKYSDIMSKLRTGEGETEYLVDLVDDVNGLLETVEQTGGGTRSAIAQSLPEGSFLAGDPDAVVEMLQVFERYDLVTLDGNTWMPGVRLSDN